MSNMLSRVAPSATEQAKHRIRRPHVEFSPPDWLETYMNRLGMVFLWVGIVVGFVFGLCAPWVYPIVLMARSVNIPKETTTNGGWWLLMDVALSIFWYTAFYSIVKAINKHGHEERWW